MINSRDRPSRVSDTPQKRPQLDGASRLRVYGPIQPMEQPNFLRRIFGKR